MVGAKVRYRNAKSVVDEFQYLSTLGFRQINVVDDLFTADKKHCIAICDEIIARGIRVKWTSFARADTVSTDLLKKMRQAGCYAIAFGFESANPDILKTVRKGITAAQMTEAVRMCVEADIIPHGSFILGLPGETPQTLKETIDFERYLDDMGAMVGSHFLAPFPGTRVREHSEEYGMKDPDERLVPLHGQQGHRRDRNRNQGNVRCARHGVRRGRYREDKERSKIA